MPKKKKERYSSFLVFLSNHTLNYSFQEKKCFKLFGLKANVNVVLEHPNQRNFATGLAVKETACVKLLK